MILLQVTLVTGLSAPATPAAARVLLVAGLITKLARLLQIAFLLFVPDVLVGDDWVRSDGYDSDSLLRLGPTNRTVSTGNSAISDRSPCVLRWRSSISYP